MFRAFYFHCGEPILQKEEASAPRIHTFIDFAILLCENPRDRPLLPGSIAKAAGANGPPRRQFQNYHKMDLFQYHGNVAIIRLARQPGPRLV
jgi:hypothetical protein